MTFFAELKRRNVVRVGIAYAVIGWALAQVAEFAVDNFGAPDWVLKTFVVFLFLGLPLALFFAWAFEMTPEGIKREKDVDRSQSITTQTGRKLDFTIIGVLVVAVGFLLTDKFMLEENGSGDNEIIATASQSIAVLPFVNMSDDKDYFADGLSEELLNLLAKIPDLKVAGRTSSFAFKGRNDDFAAIGEALKVDHVLEGSVRRSGDTLRVTAQLIKVADGYHIWSETYDREMADIFQIQDDVAGAITRELKLRLAPEVSQPTQNTEAYALYLEALPLRVYGDAEDITTAQDLLRQAIELDPQFALAYELQSDFHWLAAGWISDAPASQKLAYEAAMKALELDPTLNDAKSYAGTARPDWTWILEIEALEELVREEPGNVGALEALTYDLAMAGYFAEAEQLTLRIIELEPLASIGYWRMSEVLFAAGRREEARSYAERGAELGNSAANWLLASDSLIQGDIEAAITMYETMSVEDGLGVDPALIRAFIKAVLDTDTGKAYLNQWIETEVANASNIDELRVPYYWYILFGFLDEFYLGIDTLSGGIARGWTNADTLESAAMVFRSTGYAQHPAYLPRAKKTSMTELWDARGAPDHCSKVEGEWVCE
jgi:TolB-like protein